MSYNDSRPRDALLHLYVGQHARVAHPRFISAVADLTEDLFADLIRLRQSVDLAQKAVERLLMCSGRDEYHKIGPTTTPRR